MCLFNKYDSLTFNDLKEYSAIPDSELNNALLYLCNPKMKILDKENMKKPTFAPTEKVSVNSKFSNPNIKVNFVPTSTHKKKTTEKSAATVINLEDMPTMSDILILILINNLKNLNLLNS